VFQLQNANVQFDIITGELDSAKRESDAIFATVRQGLFLLSPDGTIGAQTSGELKTIFQTPELAKRSFSQLLRPLLPEKRYQTISDYFELLFDSRKNEKQLHKFNPLKRVELNFSSPDGGFQPKHVEFSFQRIMNNNTVTRVMVTVLDVTERVKLEDKLREGEVLREKQLELLFDLLQVDSSHLHGFLEDATGGLEKINTVFMEPGAAGGGQLQDKVQRVFRIAHNLKSQAASLGLHLFEKTVHQIEEQLNEHRRNTALVNEDLLPVLVSISNFQAQLQDASALIDKISSLRRTFASGHEEMLGANPAAANAPLPAQPSAELVRTVEDLCRTVATRTGKQARIEWKLSGNFDGLPAGHRKLLQNALFQLVRNSVVHGIELPGDRAKAGKPPCGCISIKLTKLPGENRVLLLSRDDGAGLNADAIRKRAVREKLIPEDAQLSENDLYALIFAPGFSTVDSTTEDAGRGVGLDVIRAEIVDELHGEIQIGFAAGRFCEFGIIIPTA
jgi:chemotaxis protein histidine kinase CheA